MVLKNEGITMKRVLISVLIAIVLSTAASAQDLANGRWIDLTHSFNEETIYWPTAERFKHTTVAEGYTEDGYYYCAYNISGAEHGGTHVDSPIHFAEGTRSPRALSKGRVVSSWT